MNDLGLDYFYGSEADQFSFYRLPKVLFTDARFSKLSAEAKILYGLMLDRMSLSIKNGWIDEENHVYIYFKLEDALDMLNIGKDKGVKLFAELDSEKGCGLIKRKKQGLGKPAIIYVMNFVSKGARSSEDKTDVPQTSENQNSGLPNDAEVRTSGKQKSGQQQTKNCRLRKIRTQEVGKTECNNTDNNYNKLSDTYVSDTNLILSHQNGFDRIEYAACKKQVAQNIEYDFLRQNYGVDMADGVLELITETICSSKPEIMIACEPVPHSIVKERFLKLGYKHIEYVFDCLKTVENRVKNIKSYMLTMLYNSYSTIGHYYTAEVAADFKGGF